MKVQLIHPPADIQYELCQTAYLTAPPIGLEIIARAIEMENPEARIEIFDGNLFSLEEIKQSIGADIVGVSDWYSKHRNACEILKTAKERNTACVTVMGGPNTAYLAGRILVNHQYIDYVVVGDGEETMKKIVGGAEIPRIPNLYYRKNGAINFTFHKKASLDIIFNFEHLVRKDYIFNNEKPLPLSLVRGCIKAAKKKRCAFCALPYKGLKFMKPEIAWKQIQLLKEKYGINYFFETGDTFLVGNYPEKLRLAKPSVLKDIQLRIYACPDQIIPSNLKVLERLRVQEIFLGTEGINEAILQKAGKTHRLDDIMNALWFLENLKIRSMLSFLYGLPGETKGTARATFEFAEDILREYSMVAGILTGFPIPLPGTQLFNELKLKIRPGEYRGDLERDDVFDYEQLVKLQTKYFTECSFEALRNFINKTSRLSAKVGKFGLTG